MPGMFDNTRPDPEAVRRVKTYFAEQFGLPETTLLSVAELRCHEPGCPPLETVVTARTGDGGQNDWRIAKPIKDVTAEDVASLNQNS